LLSLNEQILKNNNITEYVR
jgi:hypothetical protein